MIVRPGTASRFDCGFPLSHALSAVRPRGGGAGADPLGTGAPAWWLGTGRVALWAALRALFPEGGRRIGVQAFSCRVVFEAIRQSGNRAVFLDVSDDDYTVGPEQLAPRIGEVDAVILTHTFGTPARMREVMAVAGGVPVIEDCAHATFSEYEGTPTGGFGAAAIFSFGLGKPVSLGGGGLLQVNDPALAAHADAIVRTLPAPSRRSEARGLAKALAASAAHRPIVYGAVTLPLLKRANRALDLSGDTKFHLVRGASWGPRLLAARRDDFRSASEARRARAARLAERLDGRFRCGWARREAEGRRSNGYLFPLRAHDAEAMVRALRAEGYEAARHFHEALDHAADFGYVRGECPSTETIVRELFTVPAHRGMSLARVDRLADVLAGLARGEPSPAPAAAVAGGPAPATTR